MIAMDREAVQAAAYGGALLGGGGGGSISEGLQLGQLAIDVGRPRLMDLGELDDEAILVQALPHVIEHMRIVQFFHHDGLL